MMSDLLRQEIVQTAEVIVVKVGTNVLTNRQGRLNLERISLLTGELWKLVARGHYVVLVSSGAVGSGMGQLNLSRRPTEIPELQAVAAIGQGKLMEAYNTALGLFGGLAAQVLLTADDLSNRTRYLNTRNALRAILDFHALPIINENDTVSVEELHTTFGDNDRLAGLVANLFESPLLILLTDVDGLFDGDPMRKSSQMVPLVPKWSPSLMQMAAEKRSPNSKGGMSSKLRAAQMVTAAGGNVIIANGDKPDTLSDIFAGKETGTLFLAQGTRLPERKRWIGFAGQTKGKILIDIGAAEALTTKGKSLLPIGVLGCQGTFVKGDLVSVTDASDMEIARGLCNYSAKEVVLIQGKKTEEIHTILGHCPYRDVIHRDNLLIL
ncbi:MAG: glutamate 5-kinase [Planctomycetaceae bacterium]|jgi:glutamate 5-kinase|nr:glutamate 5-kinase [Planctomycetaceae bacterium]